MDGHLTRLAKQFKNANGGKKMGMWAVLSGLYDTATSGWLNNEWPMPNVEKEATVVVLKWDIRGPVADFYRDTIMRSPR